MKIAILVGAFPPKRLAGTEIATYNIAKYLAKRGHEIHVITSLDEGLPKESMEAGFCVHRILWRKIRFLGGISFYLKTFLALKKIDPDIVHAQSIGMGIFGFLAKKILKKPYAVWCQGSDVYLPWKLKKLRSELVLKNADAVIALTGDMKKEIKKMYNRYVFVIPNGVDLERFKDLSKETLRKRLKIGGNEKIIIFVGTLRPVKGVKYLIEAMGIMNKNKNTKLLLVGGGDEREYLRNLVNELNLERHVRFIGKITNDEVPEYMVASDVFVLPSLSESFGIVNLEAMASGLPIVATKVGGLPEVVRDGENGFLVEPKNSEEIAEKVLLLLGDGELRGRISKNNKEKIKKYTWERVVEELEGVFIRVDRTS